MLTIVLLVPLLVFVETSPIHHKQVDELVACYEKNSDELDKCLMGFWNDFRPYLVAGIPELKFTSLDPFTINEMEIEEDGELVQIKSKFRQVEIRGGGDYVVTGVRIDRKAAKVNVNVYIPGLYANGLYDVKGVVMVLPINGKGLFQLNLTEIEGTIVSHMVPHGAGVKADEVMVDFKVGDIKICLKSKPSETGPDDDDDMTSAIVDMINKNSQDILEDVKPKMSLIISDALSIIAENAMLRLPAKAFID